MKFHKYITALIWVVLFAVAGTSCQKADPRPVRDDTEIETIYCAEAPTDEGWAGVIDYDNNTIVFQIPTEKEGEIDLTELFVWISSGPIDAVYSPKLGQCDMSRPWDLTLTAGNGTKRVYTLSTVFYDGVVPVVDEVLIAQNEGDTGWEAVIDNTANTITFNIPMAQIGTVDLTQMYFWIESGTDRAAYSLESGIVDMTNPWQLTLTAADGIQRTYTVSYRYYDGIKPIITDSYIYYSKDVIGWPGIVDNDNNTIIFDIPCSQYPNFDLENIYFWIDAPNNRHGTYGTPTYEPEEGRLDMTKPFPLTVTAEDGTENIYTILGARYYDGIQPVITDSYVFKDDSGPGWANRVNNYERTIIYELSGPTVEGDPDYDFTNMWWWIDEPNNRHGTYGSPTYEPSSGWMDMTQPFEVRVTAWDGTVTVYTVLGVELMP